MAALLWDPRHDRSVRLRLRLINPASVSCGLKEACYAAAEPWRDNRNVAVRRRAGLRPRACARGPLQAHDRSTYAEDGRGRCDWRRGRVSAAETPITADLQHRTSRPDTG